GHAVGERLQFLVADAQLAGHLGQLFGLAQHDTQHGVAQFERTFDLHRLPWLGVATENLLPAFKAVTRAEGAAVAVHLFFRLARPLDGLDLFAAEPDQVMRVNARNRDRHHAGTVLREGRQVGDVTADAVAVIDEAVALLTEPLDQLHDLVVVRSFTDGFAAFRGNDRGAVGPGKGQRDVWQLAEALYDAVMIGHGRQ